MTSPFSTLQELLAQNFAQYLTVTPEGFQLDSSHTRKTLRVQIISFSPARTLYRNRKPVCRSLDSVEPLKRNGCCETCPDRKQCTPQIYLQVLVENIPRRLLLAFSSARNFLLFKARMQKLGQTIDKSLVDLCVQNHGSWGEVLFRAPSSR